jgi:lysophospholipase
MKELLLIVLPALDPLSSHAIGEDALANRYVDQIVPYLAANTITGHMQTADGASLKWLKTTNGNNERPFLLLGGHSESYLKYYELFYDLRDMGLTIFALDQRGQGFSTRMHSDRERGYVDTYERYLADLEQFIEQVVDSGSNSKLMILGHSFGGAVAAVYAERHPERLSSLILSSPYLGSKAGPLAVFIVKTLDFLGSGKNYVSGGRPFCIVPFEKNKETHSRVRHKRKMQDYLDQPIIRLGHPTNHWIAEIQKLGTEVRRDAKKIACPVLVLQAEKDAYADVSAQDKFCAQSPNCEKVLLKGAYHEILIEIDEIRDVALQRIRSFIRKSCP